MISERVGILADRYIPFRKGTHYQHFSASRSKDSMKGSISTCSTYTKLIAQDDKRCFTFSKKTIQAQQSHSSISSIRAHPLQELKEKKKCKQRTLKHILAERIIDCPEVQNNYYYNISDWSSRGQMAIALGNQCFLRNENEYVNEVSLRWQQRINIQVKTCVKFNKDGNILYIANNSGSIHVVDVQNWRDVREMNYQHDRIGCMETNESWGLLAGSKNKSIGHYDIRAKNPYVMEMVAHQQQVCGLTLKNNNVASGSNDGKIILWDLRQKQKLSINQFHKGAVKAIKWCPWKINILASGGGTKDNSIMLWNSQTGDTEEVIKGKSQVTGICWRENHRDLIAAYGGTNKGGYGIIWNCQSKSLTSILSGHTRRIISLSVNPKKQNEICTIGGDETLRIWNTDQNRSQTKIAEKQTIRSSIFDNLTDFKLK